MVIRGFWLLVPFFLLRFGLLGALNKEAIQRAAHFAPMRKGEKVAGVVYQLSNIVVFVYILFLKVKLARAVWFYTGLGLYLAGIAALAVVVVFFAKPAQSGINQRGVYRLSRNPMYVAYFIVFLGCVVLTQSLILLVLVLVFQVASHWVILAEERWCEERFGEEYLQYKERVRRYI